MEVGGTNGEFLACDSCAPDRRAAAAAARAFPAIESICMWAAFAVEKKINVCYFAVVKLKYFCG